MNVRELIEKLQEFDPELPVGITYAENEGETCWIQQFEITVTQTSVSKPFHGDQFLIGQSCILIQPGC